MDSNNPLQVEEKIEAVFDRAEVVKYIYKPTQNTTIHLWGGGEVEKINMPVKYSKPLPKKF